MAYSEFTLANVTGRLGLTTTDEPDLMAEVPPVEPAPFLKAVLAEFVPIAVAVGTERARTEMALAPFLACVRAQFGHRFNLFSGVEFPADPPSGLTGFCDILLTRSPNMRVIQAPVVAIVEAKNENLKPGLGQCIAGMVGAARFNEREGTALARVYGAVSSGTVWQFLELEGTHVRIDLREYSLAELSKLVGIIAHIAGVA